MSDRAAGPNKYSHTPRKVFDRYTEKMDRKLAQTMKELLALERVVRRLVADQIQQEHGLEQLQLQLVPREPALPKRYEELE